MNDPSLPAMNIALTLDERGVIVSCPACGSGNRIDYARLDQRPRCGRCGASIPPPGAPVNVEAREDFVALVARSAVPVLVDFWAPWCGPCKMIAPEVAKAAELGRGRWLVVKVDTERLPPLAGQFQVRAIPLLVLFHGGREIARQAGALPAAAIAHFISDHTRAAG